jgi:hypothetical protein
VSDQHPERPRHWGWSSALRAWAIIALILVVADAVAVVLGLAPHEGAAAVTFIVAELLAGEVIVLQYKWKRQRR